MCSFLFTESGGLENLPSKKKHIPGIPEGNAPTSTFKGVPNGS